MGKALIVTATKADRDSRNPIPERLDGSRHGRLVEVSQVASLLTQSIQPMPEGSHGAIATIGWLLTPDRIQVSNFQLKGLRTQLRGDAQYILLTLDEDIESALHRLSSGFDRSSGHA